MADHPPEFDLSAFTTALLAVADHRGVSQRAVADAAGTSASAITRMRQGHHPSVQNLVSLAGWAHLGLDRFIRSTEETP